MFLLRAAGNMRYPQERMVLDQGGHQCPHRVRLVLALNRPLAWPILATILLHRRSCSRRGSGDLPPTHANLHPPAHVAEHSDGVVPLPLLGECVDKGGVDAAAGLHPALGHVGKQVLHLSGGWGGGGWRQQVGRRSEWKGHKMPSTPLQRAASLPTACSSPGMLPLVHARRVTSQGENRHARASSDYQHYSISPPSRSVYELII